MIECGVVQHEDDQTGNRSGGPLSFAGSPMPTELAGAMRDISVTPDASASVDASVAPHRVVWSMTFKTDAVGPRNRLVMTDVDVTSVQSGAVTTAERLPAPRSGPDSLVPRIAAARVTREGCDRVTSRRLDVVA